MLNEFQDPDYTEEEQPFVDERAPKPGAPGGDWDSLARQTAYNREMEQIKANRQAFDQYIAIEDGAKQQKLALDHQRAIAGAAMIQSAFRNGGMSDRSLSAAFSQAFGRQIYGGQLVGGMNIGNGPETVFAMYGAAKDPQTGKATIAPVAMMGTREMLQVLKRAGLGDATNAIQDSLINNSYLGKLTDDQRAAMGVSRPSAPISTGGTEISAAGVRALRGLPRPRSSVSSYYSDGAGGEVRTYSGPETGYQNVREASGTFSPDYQGRWKVLESNGDGKRYANDRTGEEIFVPKGDTLRDVLQRGGSERERIARIQAQGRVDAAAIRAAGRGTAGNGAGAVKFDKDEFAAVKEMRAAYAPKIKNEDDEMVDNPNADPEMFRRYSDRLNQLLLGGGEGVSDGGEGAQGGAAVVDAKRQELIRRGLLNPDGTPKRPAADNGGQQSGTAQQQGTTTQQSTQKREGAPKESYDTKLTPDEESQYQEWRKTLPGPLQSEEDYDLRGYWKDPDTQKDGIKDGQHFTDRYKKPNHPTFSNESMYATGKNKSRAGHWDDNGDFVASEDQLSEREAARVKEFENLGGKYSSDSDGNVSLEIADWDYLPDDLKKHYPQTVRGDLDDDVIDVQRKAIAARKAFDEKFDKEILPGIEADAKRKFPNNEKKRNKYIDEQSIKWQHKNDPQYRREIEETSHKIWANTPIY